LSLLVAVQGLLERTYAMGPELPDAARFVIGDQGYRRFYGEAPADHAAGSADAPGARTLIRETPAGLRASIYYPDALIECLERHPPSRGLGEANVDAFATLVEELDHLLLLAERARQSRPLTLLELELHANVSKHLVLSRFLAGSSGRLDESARLWLRHHLFEKGRFCDADPLVRERYRTAARCGVRFLDALRSMNAAARLRTLRLFHGFSSAGKLRMIDRLA
jgi:hypothetical protein